MSTIEKVLLRKDIASLIVAVVAGIATVQFLASFTQPFTNELFAGSVETGQSFDSYLAPLVAFALQVLALEVLLRIVIAIRQSVHKSSK